MFHRLLLKLGISKPDIYDIMDAFIRSQLTTEEIKFIEWHSLGCKTDNYMLCTNNNGSVYFSKRVYYPICSGYCNSVPDCEEFAKGLEKYREILSKMKLKRIELIETREQEKLKAAKVREQDMKCINKLWNYVNQKYK